MHDTTTTDPTARVTALVLDTIQRTHDNMSDAQHLNYVADLAYDLAIELPENRPLREAVLAARRTVGSTARRLALVASGDGGAA